MPFSSKNLSVFYTQLGTMIQAGVSIQKALDTMERTSPSAMRVAVRQINAAVGQGEPIHQAYLALGGRFAALDQHVLAICEQSGALDTGLFSLGQYYERLASARNKMIVALIWPGLMLLAAILVPSLPQLVLGLLGLTQYTVFNYVCDTGRVTAFFIGIPVMCGLAVKHLLRVPRVNVVIDYFLNAIPVFGRFRVSYALFIWTQSIQLMLKAGYGVLEALRTASLFTPSPLIAASYQRIRPLLDNQLGVSQALASTNLFPPILIQLWATGEESGKMDEMLVRLVKHFDDEWNRSLVLLAVWLPIVVYGLISVYIGIQIFKLMGAYVSTYDNLLRETQM